MSCTRRRKPEITQGYFYFLSEIHTEVSEKSAAGINRLQYPDNGEDVPFQLE
jgi:hypothetical protein